MMYLCKANVRKASHRISKSISLYAVAISVSLSAAMLKYVSLPLNSFLKEADFPVTGIGEDFRGQFGKGIEADRCGLASVLLCSNLFTCFRRSLRLSTKLQIS